MVAHNLSHDIYAHLDEVTKDEPQMLALYEWLLDFGDFPDKDMKLILLTKERVTLHWNNVIYPALLMLEEAVDQEGSGR